MISDSFCSLNIGWVCMSMAVYLAVPALYNHMLSVQHAAVNITPQIWSLMTTMLDEKNICIAAIIWRKTSHSEPKCLTQVLPFCCMSRILWCENIAPCWFPFIHYHRHPQTMLTDRRHVGRSCSDVTERSLLDLTTVFLWFLLLLCVKSLVSFLCAFHLQQQTRHVQDTLWIFVGTSQTKALHENTQNKNWVG